MGVDGSGDVLGPLTRLLVSPQALAARDEQAAALE